MVGRLVPTHALRVADGSYGAKSNPRVKKVSKLTDIMQLFASCYCKMMSSPESIAKSQWALCCDEGTILTFYLYFLEFKWTNQIELNNKNKLQLIYCHNVIYNRPKYKQFNSLLLDISLKILNNLIHYLF